MSSLPNSRVMSIDRHNKKCVRTSLKLANSVMAFTGITILMYSVWMIAVCLRDYKNYPFPWFLWACIGTGIIFNFIACIGHIGVDIKSNLLLSMYIVLMFLLILVEGLITADICLNNDWDKDFPADPTKRFEDFVSYVKSHDNNFRCLSLLIAVSQAVSFVLAMMLRSMIHKHLNYEDDEVFISARHPFLTHNGHHYVVGHPELSYYPPSPYAHKHGYTIDIAGNHEKGEYVAAPYAHTHGYAVDVVGNEKGEYVAAGKQGYPKAC